MSNQVAKVDTSNHLFIPRAPVGVGQITDAAGEGGHWTLSFRNSRFTLRLGQDEEILTDQHLDVVLIDVGDNIARSYYAKGFEAGSSDRPDCSSWNGTTPDEGVPNKQAEHCRGCPQNVKGSKMNPNGKPGFACTFSRRAAVVLVNEDHEEERLFQMRIASTTLFGDNGQNGFSFKNYWNGLKQQVVARAKDDKPMMTYSVITRITFDLASTTPKPLFKAVAWLQEGSELGDRVTRAVFNPNVAAIIQNRPPVDVSSASS